MDPSASLESVPEMRALNNEKLTSHPPGNGHSCAEEGHPPPSPIITKRTRRESLSERAARGPECRGKVKYFCRQRGHGFITPTDGGDDIFLHILDVDGEFVPHEGDDVVYKTCEMPPKFDHMQAIHVTIKNLAPGVHERWDQPPIPHPHPHPEPNTPEFRAEHNRAPPNFKAPPPPATTAE